MPIEVEDNRSATLDMALAKISACADWMSSEDTGVLSRMKSRSMSGDLMSALATIKSLDVLWTKERKTWTSPSGHNVVTMTILPGVIDSNMEKIGALVGSHRVSATMESEALGSVGSIVDSLASKRIGRPPGEVTTTMISEIEDPSPTGLIDVKIIWHSHDDVPCSSETLKMASRALLDGINGGDLALEMADLMGLLAGLGVSIDDKASEILGLMDRSDGDGSYYADLARVSAIAGRLYTFARGWSAADDETRRMMGDDDLDKAVYLFRSRIDDVLQSHQDDWRELSSMKASIAALKA